VIRGTKFVLSHRQYAVDLSSLRVEAGFSSVDAAWFRRHDGTTRACVGELHYHQGQFAPKTVEELLRRHNDGRYGGDCLGRWDGARYWGSQDPDVIERHLRLLRPMLEGYPAIPPGYDGWWRFPPPSGRMDLSRSW
jgi:hypothetical protein